ncbi:MAG TPA: FTR1 family protein [Gaiellaceae bacterium]|nr:FTR1 family protein [Gaiellaceae bacterium]
MVKRRCPTTEELASRRRLQRRAAWSLVGAAAIGALAWKAVTAPAGVPDPTAAGVHLSHGAVIVDSGLLVFREGLEAVLVLAALTASFTGANARLRRPVAAGAGIGFAASIATWFLAILLIGELGGPGLDVQAGTGLLAVAVLLVVMNWFFHKIYWTGWISAHNKIRRRITAPGAGRRALLGLAILGFTSVYREGFEVVLFLQNLRLRDGSLTVLEGAAIGIAFTVAAAAVTFSAQHRLPYRRMLVATGILLGFVLLVMVGESIQELQLAGWLPTTPIGVGFPGFVGLWFATFPTVEGLAAQAAAAALVIGSYRVAERIRRPARQRLEPAPENA